MTNKIKKFSRKKKAEEKKAQNKLVNSKRLLFANQIGPELQQEIQVQEVPEEIIKEDLRQQRMLTLTMHKRKKKNKASKKK